MTDYARYPEVEFVYEIEKTVEIHLQSGRVFRLEVVHVVKGTAPPDHYNVRYYERQTRYIAPNGNISADRVPHSTEFYIWVPDSLPWINRPNVESALSQALGYLAERRNNAAPVVTGD
jgi:hypothetical protein